LSGCDCNIEIKNKTESKVLVTLLLINGVMFALELVIGWWAQSTALIADAMDMLADAMVYGVGLYAVGKSVNAKVSAAYISGYLQVILGLLVLLDILRRFILGSEPISLFMIGMGIIALIANTICLILISKHRNGEVHMRASWIFSKNDVIANLGVILAGGLVAWTGSRMPDLVIGIIVAGIVIKGGLSIIQETKLSPQGECK
jgi:Co/Zn/Cd efflux system component